MYFLISGHRLDGSNSLHPSHQRHPRMDPHSFAFAGAPNREISESNNSTNERRWQEQHVECLHKHSTSKPHKCRQQAIGLRRSSTPSTPPCSSRCRRWPPTRADLPPRFPPTPEPEGRKTASGGRLRDIIISDTRSFPYPRRLTEDWVSFLSRTREASRGEGEHCISEVRSLCRL